MAPEPEHSFSLSGTEKRKLTAERASLEGGVPDLLPALSLQDPAPPGRRADKYCAQPLLTGCALCANVLTLQELPAFHLLFSFDVFPATVDSLDWLPRKYSLNPYHFMLLTGSSALGLQFRCLSWKHWCRFTFWLKELSISVSLGLNNP